jgi:hypothetical protein
MCFTEMARSIPNVPPVQGARDGEQPDVGRDAGRARSAVIRVIVVKRELVRLVG